MKQPVCIESVAFCVVKLEISASVGARSRATHTLQLINCGPRNATVPLVYTSGHTHANVEAVTPSKCVVGRGLAIHEWLSYILFLSFLT